MLWYKRFKTNGVSIFTTYKLDVFFLIFILFLLWAWFFKLDILIHGVGIIKVESHNIILQSSEGGVVVDVKVKDGDEVKKNQLLVVVDNTSIDEAYSKNLTSKEALQAKAYRLEAEISGSNMSEEGFRYTGESAKIAYEGELKIFNVRQESQRQIEAVYQSQINQKEAEIIQSKQQINDLMKEIQIQKAQLDILTPLVRKGAASQNVLLQRQSEYQRIYSTLNQTKSDIPKLNAELAQVKSQRSQDKADFLSKAQQELVDIKSQLQHIILESAANDNRKKSSEIYSPTEGQIHRVFVPHLQLVVKSGDNLIEIIPQKTPRIIEVKVKPEDRDNIWVGMTGRIRLKAYSSASREIHGRIDIISPDTITEQNGERNYLVTLSILEKEAIDNIYPGMSVDVYFEAGQRTLLSYITKPISELKFQALTEPGRH